MISGKSLALGILLDFGQLSLPVAPSRQAQELGKIARLPAN
jgi:hypothetical protein